MKVVFVDSQYYIAVIHPRDQWRSMALAAVESRQDIRFVTSEWVLGEVMNFFSDFGASIRLNAAEVVKLVLSDPTTDVISITADIFRKALDLYERRPDKQYSLIDCISMVICRDREITDVLSHDHHFTQEGLTVLM